MTPPKSGVNLNTPPSKIKRALTPSSSSQDKLKTPTPSSNNSASPKKLTSKEDDDRPPGDISFIVRPSVSKTLTSSMKIYLNLDMLRRLGLAAGNLVIVSRLGEKGVVGIVSPSGSKISNNVVEISSIFRRILGVVAGERVCISKFNGRPDNALIIKLGCSKSANNIADKEIFSSGIKDILKDIGILTAGLRFKITLSGNDAHGVIDSGIAEEIVVTEVEGLPDMNELRLDEANMSSLCPDKLLSPVFYYDDRCDIQLSESMNIKTGDAPSYIGYSSLGGLSRQISILRSKIELPLHRPELFKRFNISPDRGFLVYGPPGTGKTMLLKAVAHETDAHVLTINGPSIVSKYLGETESALRAIFQEAREYEPSIIFIDEIDALVPKRDSDDSGEAESRVVSTLLTLMDGMGASGRVVVIGATNRPNSVDPALRRPGRFGQEIEVGIPDANGRLEILNIYFSSMPHDLSNDFIVDIANKTHGYVGADLYALCRDAVMRAIQRGIANGLNLTDITVQPDDVVKAMVDIRPSAMREIVLETPKVRWSDIGGQEHVKQKLKEMIEWPLSHPKSFSRLGVHPPKGVLLYGPPGCSKTLIAKALATEAGLNFLAVKGPELFNKFVGESERAVREIFRKARAAAPSIIFFDEIDALSIARGHGEAGGDRVLTSLLNEMDGIEALKDVTILAATNIPDTIDSALMRPGRLDRLIYVGPPDSDARTKILQIQFSKMQVGSDVDIDSISSLTEGCSGAEVVGLCQEAGINAMNEDLDIEHIGMRHFELALKSIRRGITKEVVQYFEEFARSAGGSLT